MNFFDIHTHQRKQSAGVEAVYSLSLSEQEASGFIPPDHSLSIGLHPWHILNENVESQIALLKVLSLNGNVKLIGECGLDRLKGPPLAAQIPIFEKQIQLAEELHKPLIIHCVRCFNEVMEIKSRLKVRVPMIIHGFNKSVTLGRQLLKQGFYLSFGADVLKPGSNAANFVKDAGDYFFLETDNSAVPIEKIYEVVADLRKISVNQLKDIIFASRIKTGIL